MSGRIRILVAGDCSAAAWQQWQGAIAACAGHSPRMALQRLASAPRVDVPDSVGLGYAQTTRWFGRVDTDERRRLLVSYAAAVLERGEFPAPAGGLRELSLAAPSKGIVLLSHAETDLLALERARAELPVEFPRVAAHSLNGITGPNDLSSLLGSCNGPDLLVIARIHGPVASVPGLAQLITQAQADGWCLAVISGVGASVEATARTSNVPSGLADNLTAYFQAGGVHNVAQALRYAAQQCFGLAAGFEPVRPMPQHGLYHPDLLVTTVGEWNEYGGRDLPMAGDPPVAAVLFYRAHVLSGNLDFVDQLIRALERRGCRAIGIFTSSLRDVDASGVPFALRQLPSSPDVVVNTVSYPVVTRSSLDAEPASAHCFESLGVPFLQAVCCGASRDVWAAAAHGLSPVEAAMNVALPECDGRVITVAVSFKESHRYRPDAERIGRVADLAQRFVVLRRKRNADKKIALVLSNSGGKAQRIGGAIGLDTPASLLRWLGAMRTAGYHIGALPETPDALMNTLLGAGCYDEKHALGPATPWRMPRARYLEWFLRQPAGFQKSVRDVWGAPSVDGPVRPAMLWRGEQPLLRRALPNHEPHSDRDSYLFCGVQLGNVFLAVQPPRAFGIDADTTYHAPDLPPCHHYAAFYRWLAEVWGADALIHFGTHGTLEWLPGKSLALSSECAPDVLLADLPLFYPFVMNNPGEGAQAKRRTHAVIIDHLVAPLTHAESHGSLASLARLVEEYYRTEALDPDKLPHLQRQIRERVCEAELAADLKELRRERHGTHEHVWDLAGEGALRALERLTARGFAHLIEDLDTYLCDLGRAQIRGGLHTFGAAPEGTALVDLVFAILRGPNGAVPSLVDAVTRACGIQLAPLRECRGVWPQPTSPALALQANAAAGQVRTAIDDLARTLLGELAARGFAMDQVAGVITRAFARDADRASAERDVSRGNADRASAERDVSRGNAGRVHAVAHDAADLAQTLQFACEVLVPNIARTTDETRHLLQGLEGKYVPAGPAGSPSRGMAHLLPTGRNFYTFDPRGLPTQAAWATGEELARQLLVRHFADAGRWPENIAMSVWGTPTLRTGGDEIAQALALLGVRPIWDSETHRTCGLEIVPPAELGRPRVDVTLRVSGFFRDALTVLIQLVDDAVRRVAVLEEPPEENFVRKHWLAARSELLARGIDTGMAHRRASYRVFGPKPGAYGTGLLQLTESGAWTDARDLASATVSAAGWAYGEGGAAVAAEEDLVRLLERVDLVVQCQDSREQDLFDSSDYFESHGGLVVAAARASGRSPPVYFADSSDPWQPRVRTLQLEALRVYRSRVTNPKWLAAMQRHGYRGGLEMASTVDCLFGYAATTGIVTDWMFEGVASSFTGDGARRFLERCNPWALNAIAERLLEAEQRGLWKALPQTSAAVRAVLLESEAALEGPLARSAGHS